MGAVTLSHAVLPFDYLLTWGEALQSLSLSDKPAFDACTAPAMCCQMRTVTCPADCGCVGYQERPHDHCQHRFHSETKLWGKLTKALQVSFSIKTSKGFNERTFDKNYATWEYDKLVLV